MGNIDTYFAIQRSAFIVESPDVGSSTKRIEGSRINSNAILSRLRWPPLRILFRGLPTIKSRASTKSKSLRARSTNTFCSSLDELLNMLTNGDFDEIEDFDGDDAEWDDVVLDSDAHHDHEHGHDCDDPHCDHHH